MEPKFEELHQSPETTITLPNDEALRQRLLKKQQEYAGRVELYKGDLETIEGFSKYADSLFKNLIITKLLTDGQVNLIDIAKSIPDRDDNAFDAVLANAFSVIKGYAKDGGTSITGGTGLPE